MSIKSISKWQYIDSPFLPDKPCPLIDLDLANSSCANHGGVWKHNPRDLWGVLSWPQNYCSGQSSLVEICLLISSTHQSKQYGEIYWNRRFCEKDS